MDYMLRVGAAERYNVRESSERKESACDSPPRRGTRQMQLLLLICVLCVLASCLCVCYNLRPQGDSYVCTKNWYRGVVV